MTVTASYGPDGTGFLTIANPPAAGTTLQLSLSDPATGQYLTPAGWSATRKTLARPTTSGGPTEIPLTAATVACLKPGASYYLEDIFASFREPFVWPAEAPKTVPAAAEEIPAPVAADTAKARFVLPPRLAVPGAFALGLLVAATPLAALWHRDAAGHMAVRSALETDLAGTKEALSKAQSEGRQAAQSADALQARFDAERAEKQALERTSADRQTALEAELTRSKADARQSAETAAQLQTLLAASSKDRDETVTTLQAQLRNELAAKQARERELLDQQSALETELARTQADARQATDANTALQAQLAAVQAQLEQVEHPSTDPQAPLRAERDALVARVNELSSQAASLTAELKALRERPPEVASADPAGVPAMTEDEKMALLKQVHDLTMKNLDMSQTISQWTPQLKQYQDTYYRLQQQEALNAAQAKNYEERIAQLRMEASAPTRAVWGAVVLDAQGKIFTVANQVSAQVAADTTRFACRGQDHRGRCEIIETYQNTCFAWARIANDGLRPDNFAYAFDTNPRQAENIALTKCAEIDGRRCRLPSPAVCAPDQLNAN